MIYSQNDPRWQGKQLGRGTRTIGSDGCYLTSFANIVELIPNDSITPADLNDQLVPAGGFVGSMLASDAVLDGWWNMHYAGTSWYSGKILTADDLNSLSDAFNEQYILEIFIGENPSRVHFVLFYDGHTDDSLRIIDPWDGQIKPLSVYGVPSRIIEKVVHYQIPVAAPAAPETPAPSAEPDPAPQPESTPLPPEQPAPADPVPAPEIQETPAPVEPNPPVAEPVLPDPVVPVELPIAAPVPANESKTLTKPFKVNIISLEKELENNVKNIIAQKLTSRKFWVAVGSIIALGLAGQWTAAAGVAMTYLGLQGYIDSKGL